MPDETPEEESLLEEAGEIETRPSEAADTNSG